MLASQLQNAWSSARSAKDLHSAFAMSSNSLRSLRFLGAPVCIVQPSVGAGEALKETVNVISRRRIRVGRRTWRRWWLHHGVGPCSRSSLKLASARIPVTANRIRYGSAALSIQLANSVLRRPFRSTLRRINLHETNCSLTAALPNRATHFAALQLPQQVLAGPEDRHRHRSKHCGE